MLDSYKHSQPTLWGHATRDPRQVLARGQAPFDPHPGGRERSIMSAGRKVWVKIRASEAERAEWQGLVGKLILSATCWSCSGGVRE